MITPQSSVRFAGLSITEASQGYLDSPQLQVTLTRQSDWLADDEVQLMGETVAHSSEIAALSNSDSMSPTQVWQQKGEIVRRLTEIIRAQASRWGFSDSQKADVLEGLAAPKRAMVMMTEPEQVELTLMPQDAI